MERWEYLTTFIEARMEALDSYALAEIPAGEHPKFSPFAAMPALNSLGAKGWELIEIRPVVIGRNHDIMVHPNNMIYWSSTYFCVFKRRAS